jgi:hypothetical protein
MTPSPSQEQRYGASRRTAAPRARQRPVTRAWLLSGVLVLATGGRVAAQDSAFHALQERGKVAMGVDQYSSTHHFTPLPDGGSIALQRDPRDTAGTRAIRAHLQHIAAAFAAGDFTLPGFVHARGVPGTGVMIAKRAAIRYGFHPLPGGGEVRVLTGDPEAVQAIHAFLAFQRRDHRVAQGRPEP